MMDIKIADWVKALFLAALLAIVYLFLQSITRILSLLVMVAIVVYLVNPFVQLLSRLIKSRTLAVILASLIFLIIVAVAIAIAAPLLAREFNSFSAGLPGYARTSKATLNSVNRYLKTTPLGHYVRLEPATIIAQAEKQLAAQGGAAFQLVTSALGLLVQLFLIFVTSLYALLLLPTFDRWVRSGSSPDLVRTYDAFVVFLDSEVNKYVKGIIALLFTIGVLVGVGLWLIGVPNALILGVVAGALEVIPYFGPLIAAIPILIVAATVNWTTALLAVGVMLAASVLENYVLSPYILGKSAEINPLAVLLLILVGGELAGLLGVFLAVPVFIILRSIQRFVREKFSYVHSSTEPDRIVLKKR